MPIFKNARYLRWFLAHIDELRPLLDLPDQLREAQSLQERWEIIKAAADRVVLLLDDFPLMSIAAEDSPRELATLQTEIEAQGIAWDKIVQLLPVIVQIIELLRGQTE